MSAPRLDIDLSFCLEDPSATRANPRPTKFEGTITAAGFEVKIFASRPELLLGGSAPKLREVRTMAARLARVGYTITLFGPGGVIARIGRVRAPLIQRLFTRSAHIWLGSAATLVPLLSSRDLNAMSLPPATLFPLVPTVSRRIRRTATTTHYTRGSGRPRLIFVVGSENWNGEMPRVFDLLAEGTTIGSSPDADLQLAGLKAMHAEIRHTANDEYALYPINNPNDGPTDDPTSGAADAGFGVAEPGTPGGRSDSGRVLRTGARIELGNWKMAYFREEFADHGRPHGGRVGGEFARQKPQVNDRPGN